MTETQMLTQIEILKTDMGKVQRQLFDMTVEKRVLQDTLLKVIDKLIQEAKTNDSCC